MLFLQLGAEHNEDIIDNNVIAYVYTTAFTG